MKLKNLLFLLFPFFANGQDFKPTILNGELIDHGYYSLSYNEQHEQAEWVYYHLTSTMISGSFKRTDNFRSDPFISSGSASLTDYKGSGYDRGHLAPAADMKLSVSAMSESFFLSNMSPQDPSFNRGAWKKLETLIRNWVLGESSVYVVTGPIFNDNLGSIGYNNVTIPGYFYKVVYSDKNKEMIGFVMPNQKTDHDLKIFVRSVDFIENQTGIDFFYQLEDNLESELEATKQSEHWNFSDRNSQKSKTKSSLKTVQSSQCVGKTKSTGSRCKNLTKNSNGYCYIHQSQSPNFVKPKPSNYVGRCNAITKAGTRCKRNASSGR